MTIRKVGKENRIGSITTVKEIHMYKGTAEITMGINSLILMAL